MDILSPSEVTALSAGAKAEGLLLLQNAGCTVPAFLAVSVDAMSRHTRADGFMPPDDALCSALYKAIDVCMPGTALFSVRSSALAEDGAEASFAGQFCTRLSVHAWQLPQAIHDCWQSSRSEAVLAYAAEKHAEPEQLRMGVVIQQMVQAELSGVVFSSNPQGLLSECVIVCGRGSGDGVVENRVSAATTYWYKPDGTHYSETPPDAPQLPPALTAQLAATAIQMEAQCGFPVDIEYAVFDGELHFLQCRPVTTLANRPITVLDNSNIVESYPGLSQPLTASFAGEVYYGVFRGLARRCLPNKRLLADREDTLRNMVQYTNGRMYYQISNWYSILQYLPLRKKIIPVWQRMLGVSNKEYAADPPHLTLMQRLSTNCRIASSLLFIPAKMRRLHRTFLAVEQHFYEQMAQPLTPAQLANLYQDIAGKLLKKWDITLLNDLYTFAYTGLLEASYKKAGVNDPHREAGRAITAHGQLASMEPIRALVVLADEIAQNATLREALCALSTEAEIDAFLKKEHPLAQKLHDYIRRYGDRAPEELKLESMTFRSAPELLVSSLMAYVTSPPPILHSATAEKAIPPRGLAGLWRRNAVQGVRGRESSRLDRSRIFGMVRTIFSAIGTQLASCAVLAQPDDVFWLTREEVFALAYDDSGEKDAMAKMIARRKRDLAQFAALPAYPRLIFAGEVFDKHPQFAAFSAATGDENSTHLQGTPCAPGIAEGVVRIITSPSGVTSTKGEILVTRSTDPGWVFLLATSGGVVSEKGSLLSHSAIIARELGIPLIAGVEYASTNLHNGDRIRIDGADGSIEVIERYES